MADGSRLSVHPMLIGVHEFWSFILIFARVSALLVTAPVFGANAVPRPLKIGFAALLSFTLLPLVSPSVGQAPADVFTLIARLAAETAVGLSLGFLVVLLFAAIEIAGAYVDTQMGFGMINLLNPVALQQSTATGQLMYQLAITLFLIGGGLLYLTGALAASYSAVPAGGAHFAGDAAGAISSLAAQMLILAAKIAAPAAAVLLVVDVAFGIVARTVPQMNILIVGLPAKIIIGVMTVSLGLPVVALVVREDIIPGIGTAAKALLWAAR